MRLAQLPPLPEGYTADPRPVPRRLRAPQQPAPRVPSGLLLSGSVTAVGGLTIHRHAYRTTDPRDQAWTAHGYAWRCPRCREIGGAHEHFAHTYDAAERHICQEEPRVR